MTVKDQKEKDTEEEKVIIGLPVFSKPLFYLILPVAKKKGKRREEEGGEEEE